MRKNAVTKERVSEKLAARGITLVGDFTGVNERHALICAKGHEWVTALQPVLRKNNARGCPHCAGVARLTEAETTKRLAQRGIRLVGAWVDGSCVKRAFECERGHVWETTLHSVLGKKKTGCPECAEYNKPQPEKVKLDLAARGLTLVAGYKNFKKKTLIRCSKGHEWSAALSNVIGDGRTGCPVCQRVTEQEVVARLKGRGITLIGEYVNTQVPTRFRCDLGHEWVTAPNLVLNGGKSGCPTCATSGFKPDKPAYFYVVKIESNMGEYVGFGITKNVDARLARHRANAFKAGVSLEPILTKFFSSGHAALRLEKQVLRSLPRVDASIEGFRKEATAANNLTALLRILEQFKHETA